MLNRILSLLAGNGEAKEQARFERVQVATCALLLEVAHSDGDYHVVEEKIVNDLLAKKFNLSAAAVSELVAHAHEHRAATHDLFQFAREINAHFSHAEKLDIMEGVWRIIYADGSLDKFEDAIARQLSTLLRLDDNDALARKLKVLEETRGEK